MNVMEFTTITNRQLKGDVPLYIIDRSAYPLYFYAGRVVASHSDRPFRVDLLPCIEYELEQNGKSILTAYETKPKRVILERSEPEWVHTTGGFATHRMRSLDLVRRGISDSKGLLSDFQKYLVLAKELKINGPDSRS